MNRKGRIFKEVEEGDPMVELQTRSLAKEKNMPVVTNFLCGFAGRDVTVEDYKAMFEKASKMSKRRVREEDYILYGVRE